MRSMSYSGVMKGRAAQLAPRPTLGRAGRHCCGQPSGQVSGEDGQLRRCSFTLPSAVGTHTVDRAKVHPLGHTARLAVVDEPLPSP